MTNRKLWLAIISVIVLAVIVFIIFQTNSPQDSVTSEDKSIDKNLLVGDWIRTDASYLIKIKSVNEDGTFEAKYFNPKPINVESAAWEESYGNLKIIVVLRDVNYPGSKYTLNYFADRDILAGDYFQAVEGLTFYVEFVRHNNEGIKN